MGKKTEGIAVLTPMQGDWGDFITGIQEAEAAMTFPKLILKIGEDTVRVSLSYRTMTFTFEENGEQKSQMASYIVTETGYKFYAPVEVLGVSLSGFTFDAANQWFTEYNNAAVVLLPVPPSLNEQFVAGNWYFAYSALSASVKPYFAMAANGSASDGEEIVYMYMGSTADGYGFYFQSGGYKGYLGYNYTLIGEDQITLSFALSGDNNGVYYYNNLGYNYVVSIVGPSAGKTYTLTTDDLAAPTYITLTDNANPANVMTLSKAVVNYPFDN